MEAAQVVADYLRERAALVEGSEASEAAARKLSSLTDGAVSELAEAALAGLRRPWALLALGGWGGGLLVPGSDLDLLVVTDSPSSQLAGPLRDILYPLWDAGLTLGQQVRSRRDHARMCRADRDTLTATLTGRVIAGDPALGARVLADVASDAHRRRSRVLRMLAERDRPGSPYLLEPDLKEGAGGKRDLDEFAWMAAVLAGRPAAGLGALVESGVLAPDEVGRIDAARERLTTARWSIQAGAPRASSLLTLDAADVLGPARVAGLQRSLADVHHLLARARARANRHASSDVPLEADTLFRLLAEGESSLPKVEEAAWAGRLDDVVPGFSDLMVLRRPALAHRWTVGAHSLRTATLVGPRARTDRALAAAALIHDIGKMQRGPGHASRGAGTIATLAGRLGLGPDDAVRAATLIREHLLLPEVAFSEDIHDEDVVLRAAARIGSRELVEPLRALTEADAKATGDGAWTPWHAALVGELVDRLDAALSDAVDGAGIADSAERSRVMALTLLPAEERIAVEFVERAALRYLAAHSPAEIVAHARLLADLGAAGAPGRAVVGVTPGPAEGTWAVSVAARDRIGLFSAMTGALALAGFDIVSASAHETPDGAVLDVFVVRPDTLAGVDDSRWASFERLLTAALDGHLDIDARLAERRSHYRRGRRSAVRVGVEPDASYATAVYVHAPDRVGLLHDVARAFALEGLDIRRAMVITLDGTARDVFHVVDADGEPITDPGVLGHLAMRIRDTM